MTWAQSLIRIANHEVETLQKRLAVIADRRMEAVTRAALLDAEAETEAAAAEGASDPFSALAHASYAKAWKGRKAAALAEADRIAAEEEGARDALTAAFESLKKFEHVAERARLEKMAERAKRETAGLDEIALRRAAAR